MTFKNWDNSIRDGVPKIPYMKTKPPGENAKKFLEEATICITPCWAGKPSAYEWDLPIVFAKDGSPSQLNSLFRDADGNVFVDLMAGITTQNMGYNNPEIIDRAQNLLKEYGVSPLGPSNDYCYPLMIEASKKLLGTIPNGNNYVVHYSCGGTEGNEAAIKYCISAKPHSVVIGLQGAFYGRTTGSLSAMGLGSSDMKSWNILQPSGIRNVPGPTCPYCKYGNSQGYLFSGKCEDITCFGILEEDFAKGKTAEIAGLLFELYPTGGGEYPIPPTYVKALQQLSKELDFPIITDQIQGGFGRSGRMWIHEWYDGFEPDIITIGKSAGYVSPLSGAIIKKDLMAKRTAYHGSTYGGAPYALAGLIANIEFIQKYNMLSRAAKLGEMIKRETNELVFDNRRNIGKGVLLGLDIRDDEFDKFGRRKPNQKLTKLIKQKCFENGLVLMGGGYATYRGSFLRITPPATIPENDLETSLDIIVNSVKEAKNSA